MDASIAQEETVRVVAPRPPLRHGGNERAAPSDGRIHGLCARPAWTGHPPAGRERRSTSRSYSEPDR